MVSKIFSCTLIGLECRIIEVQADISNGLPAFSIVGLGDTSVQESKERVRSSIKNSGAKFPQTRKTINLAPAQVRKQGALFDLPIAVSILLASGQLSDKKITNSIFVGELSLTGDIKPINGALAITQFAKEQGFKKIFLPKDNSKEASFIDGIDIYPLESIKELIKFCNIENYILQKEKHSKIIYRKHQSFINQIYGHKAAKRALIIAASGGHNTLMEGSPGCGKTLLCRSFAGLMPQMSKEEIFETTKIYSITGNLKDDYPLITQRPFREVHHTASKISIVGGGGVPAPGEISLAHNGVIFFDEIAEFDRVVLETLRQPLEDKYINLNRAKYSLRFPSNFVLLATMNPCPCGYARDKKIRCVCTKNQIRNYRKKISGPLIDRFDIFLEIPKVRMDKAIEEENEEEDYLGQIEKAREIQNNRFANLKINKNSEMELDEIKKFCPLSKEASSLLSHANKKFNLSNRGYLKLIKLARTIADLDLSNEIKTSHLSEAVQYRRKESQPSA